MVKKTLKILLLLAALLALIGCGKSSPMNPMSHEVRLGEKFHSSTMIYTVTESTPGGFLEVTAEDNMAFGENIEVTLMIYPNSKKEKVSIRNMVFDYDGEKYIFMLPFTIESLPLRVYYQETFNTSSSEENEVSNLAFNWGFRVEK